MNFNYVMTMKLDNLNNPAGNKSQRDFSRVQALPPWPVPQKPSDRSDKSDPSERQPSKEQPPRRNSQAFTLVEMLLVLVILGVLAAIVYPKIAGRGEQARVTATIAQLSAFKTALDAFEVDNGYYPKGKNGLMDLVQKPRDAVNWHGYLDSIPKDPWQHDYIYECPGRHNPSSYDLMSAGPDGRVGSEDDICNWQGR